MRTVKKNVIRTGGAALLFLLGSAVSVFAAPPASPYLPGETVAPTCQPGSSNCTVRMYAASGANADITSLGGLTTPLSVTQGGTGRSSYTPYGILYATNATTLGQIGTSSLGILTDDLVEGLGNLFFTATRGNALINATSTIATLTSLPNLVNVGTITSGLWQGSPIDASQYLSNLDIPLLSFLQGRTADDLLEGAVNQYYRDSKVTTYLDSLAKSYFFATSSSDHWLSLKNTDDIIEGVTNVFFTDGRVDNRINATTTIGTLTSLPHLGTVGTIASGVWQGTPIDAVSYVSNLDLIFDGLFQSLTSDDLSEGLLHQYYEDSKVGTYLGSIAKSYFFATSSTDTWLSQKTTNDLAEGLNHLFFTDARGDARISATTTIGTLTSLPNLSSIGTITSGLWEGSPIDASQYLANLDVPFLSLLGGVSSDDLSEGIANEYYRDSKVGSYLNSIAKSYFFATSSTDQWLSLKTSDDLAEGISNVFFTDERADSRISATTSIASLTSLPNLGAIGTVTSGIWNGSPIDASVYLSNLTVPLSSFIQTLSTDDLSEGSLHEYYEDSKVGSYLGALSKSYFFATSSSDHWLSDKSTDDLAEGISKLFFTVPRTDQRINATSTIGTLTSLPNLSNVGTIVSGLWQGSPIDASQYLTNLDIPFADLLGNASADDLAEGSSNQYYRDTRVASYLDSIAKSYFFATSSSNQWLSQKTTDDLAEGVTRLFFTTARGNALINATSTIGTLTSLPNLSTLGTIVSGVWNGTPIDAVSYVSNLGVPFYALLHSTSTDALLEGVTNKYYSDTRVGSYISSSTTIPHIAGSAFGNLLAWNGSSWTSQATSSLGMAVSDLIGTLSASQGGTGLSTIQSGALLYGSGGSVLATTAPAAAGQVLSFSAGVPVWTATTTFSGALSYIGGNVSIPSGAIGNSLLANSSVTFSAGNGLSGGGAVSLGSSASVSLNLGNPNSWSALQQFQSGASTTILSVYNRAYFGSTATSSFGLDGKLSLANIGTNLLLTADGSGSVTGSSTPTAASYLATSTTATSSFAGGFSAGSALYVLQNGRVGLGTAAPSYPLHIRGDVSGTVAKFETNGGSILCVLSGLSGLLSCSSDARLKTDVNELSDDTFAKVLDLRPVSYRWKTDDPAASLKYGFIAQEVETLFPELVSNDTETGYKVLSLEGLVPFVVKALQREHGYLQSLISESASDDPTLAIFQKDFAARIAASVRGLLADTANGIEDLFARRIHSSEVCLSKSDGTEICITGDQLEDMVSGPSRGTSSSVVEEESQSDGFSELEPAQADSSAPSTLSVDAL